jgi:hypothetical protein
MVNLLLQGVFYDCYGNDHNLTDFEKTSIYLDSNDHILSINLNSDGYYHIELQNAHFGDLHTGIDFYGDRVTVFDPVISIIPDDSTKSVSVNLLNGDKCIQSISILPQDFDFISIIPEGYGQYSNFNDYANNFGHNLLVMQPYGTVICPPFCCSLD